MGSEDLELSFGELFELWHACRPLTDVGRAQVTGAYVSRCNRVTSDSTLTGWVEALAAFAHTSKV